MKKVFISYSHDDINFRAEAHKFLVNLERDKLIEIWHDGHLTPGDQWDSKILGKLESADIIILLISQSFISSTYIFEKEMARSLTKASEGSAKIIPVLLKNCDWYDWIVIDPEVRAKSKEIIMNLNSLNIKDYQFLPQNDNNRLQPITKWVDQDDAWMQLTQAIRKIVKS